MQIPPLEGEEHAQHKIKEEESDQSKMIREANINWMQVTDWLSDMASG